MRFILQVVFTFFASIGILLTGLLIWYLVDANAALTDLVFAFGWIASAVIASLLAYCWED